MIKEQDYKKLLVKIIDDGVKNASSPEYEDLVKFLFTLCGDDLFSALDIASEFGYTNFVIVMIKKVKSDDDLKREFDFIDVVSDLLCLASKGGHKSLINYLINEEEVSWINGMEGAAKGGNKELVEFFIEKGMNDKLNVFHEKMWWNVGMGAAVEGGHDDLIDYFIEKGANDWDRGLWEAIEHGRKHLINFFVDKGVHLNDGMQRASKKGDAELVNYFISKGANDWSSGLIDAAAGGHKNLVDFFIEKGVKNYCWARATEDAIENGNHQIADYIKSFYE